MPQIDNIRNQLITSFYDNSVMLNIAMNIEQFLCDDAILYPYANWEKGEIISGPFIKRYFVSVVLRFDYKDMPDPTGIEVLEKFGVITTYKKAKEKKINYEKSQEQSEKVYEDILVWYVQLDIPRDLVSDDKQRDSIAQIENLLDIEAIEDVAENNQDSGDMESDTFGGDFGGDFGGNDFGDDGFDSGDFEDDNFDLGDDLGDEPAPEPEKGDKK